MAEASVTGDVVLKTVTGDVVLKICLRADGARTPVYGQFVAHYDPTIAADGAYRLDTTSNITEAVGFPTIDEAAAYIQRPSPNVPFDGPGHVNRPITAYTIELVLRERTT